MGKLISLKALKIRFEEGSQVVVCAFESMTAIRIYFQAPFLDRFPIVALLITTFMMNEHRGLF